MIQSPWKPCFGYGYGEKNKDLYVINETFETMQLTYFLGIWMRKFGYEKHDDGTSWVDM